MMPNALEPTGVGAVRSVVAVHAAGRPWLRLRCASPREVRFGMLDIKRTSPCQATE
jgi:hypothetical protein